MKLFTLNAVWILSFILAAGCSSIKPHSSTGGFAYQYVPLPPDIYGPVPADKARIFFIKNEYSMFQFNNEASMERVFDGRVLVGDLTESSYLCWEKEPGVSTVILAGSTGINTPPPITFLNGYKIDAKAGNAYYLYLGPISPIFMGIRRKFISEAEAQKFLEMYPRPTMGSGQGAFPAPQPMPYSQPVESSAAQSSSPPEKDSLRPV